MSLQKLSLSAAYDLKNGAEEGSDVSSKLLCIYTAAWHNEQL